MRQRLLLLCALLVLALPMQAQSEWIDTYTAPDGSFSVTYPADFAVVEGSNANVIVMTGTAPDGSDVDLTLYTPGYVRLNAPEVRRPAGALSAVARVNTLQLGEVIDVPIGDRDGALALLTDAINAAPGGFGISIALDDGAYAVLIAETGAPSLEGVIPLVAGIAGTIQPPDVVIEVPQPTLDRANLDFQGRDWRTVVRELAEADYIDPAGGLVFEASEVVLTGTGSQFFPLAVNDYNTDVVIGAEIIFRPGAPPEAYEECGLLGRVVVDAEGTLVRALRVGVDNTPNLLYYDTFGSAEGDFEAGAVGVEVTWGEPQHVVLVASGDTVTVFLNGERILNEQRVVERRGSFGAFMASASAATGCLLQNIWAYQLDTPLDDPALSVEVTPEVTPDIAPTTTPTTAAPVVPRITPAVIPTNAP